MVYTHFSFLKLGFEKKQKFFIFNDECRCDVFYGWYINCKSK